jgi:hypothetical protein
MPQSLVKILVHRADFYWQESYGAFSIGQSQVEIRNRKHHHLSALLEKYELEYNEQYIWD